VHTHELLISERELTEGEIDAIFGEWRSASLAAGLKAPSRLAFDLRQVNAEHGSSYLTKYAIANEIADAGIKHSRGGYTYLDLLKLAGTGSKLAISLIREYAAATKGRQRMEFGRFWREILGCDEKPATEDGEEHKENDRDVIVMDAIGNEVWMRVLAAGARWQVLAAYRSGGTSGGRRLLDAIWLGAQWPPGTPQAD
jgi:hypothetical protein